VGATGISVQDLYINYAGELIVTFSNNAVLEVGYIITQDNIESAILDKPGFVDDIGAIPANGANTITADAIVATSRLGVPTQTPANATAAGTAGTITWDANYLYVCIATNTWRRIQLSTWT
jgi:hypothetical protein